MSFIANAVRDITGANQQAQAITTAANTQAAAANNAAALQNAQFQQTQQNLAPYMSIGTAALPQLIQSLGYQGQYGSNGSMGLQNAQSVGNTLMSGAHATAAGQVAAGSSQTNALNSLMGLGMGGAGIYALGAKSGMNSALSSGASSLYNGITGLFSAGAGAGAGAGAVGTGAGASDATIAAFA